MVMRPIAPCFPAHALLLLAALAAPPRAWAQAPEGEWYLLGAHDQLPLPRSAVTLFDARHDRLLMIGGHRIDSTGFTRQGATVFAIAGMPARDWAPLFEGTGDVPLRSGAGAVADSVSDRVLLWGGARIFPSGLVAPLDADLFRMDASGAWVREAAGSPAPRPRRDHGLVLDRARRRLVVYGGRDALDGLLGDVWVRGVDVGAAWDSVETVGTPPRARMHTVVLYDEARDRLLVLAGQGFEPSRLGDAHQLDFSVDPPRWSALPNATDRVAGPAFGATDRARDRALVFGDEHGDPYEWRFASDSLRRMAAFASPPGAPLTPGSAAWPLRIAVHDVHAVAVVTTPKGQFENWAPPWRFSTAMSLAAAVPAQFTVAPPTASFALGITSLRWEGTAAGLRALPQPVLPGQPPLPLPITAIRTQSGFFPDMGGAYLHDRTALEPGRTHSVALEWFEGTVPQSTPLVDFMTPFGPLEVSVVLDSIVGTSEGVVTEWHLAPVDSLRQYAPTQLERRLDGGTWVAFAPGAFPDSTGRFRVVDGISAPGHGFEYRIRWESPVGTRRSAIARYAWLDAPVFEGIEAGVDSFVARWRVNPGVLFHMQLLGLRPGEAPVLLGEDEADQSGAIRVAVRPVRPDTLYRLMGAWVNGGLSRTSTPFQYQSGISAITRVSLSVRGGIGSPARLRVFVPAGEVALATLHDVTGRAVWAVRVPPGVTDVRPDPALTPSGLYFAKVLHATGAVTARVVIVQ